MSFSFQPNLVSGPVALDHRGRGHLGRGVAAEAGRVRDLDGPGDGERAPGRRVALAAQLGDGRLVLELLDEVGFPVGRPVAVIGRGERRLLGGVVGVLLLDRGHGLGGRVRGHALREEHPHQLQVQLGSDLIHRVGPDGEGRLHHEVGVADDVLSRVPLEEIPGYVAGHGQPQEEHDQEHQVELPPQAHAGDPPSRGSATPCIRVSRHRAPAARRRAPDALSVHPANSVCARVNPIRLTVTEWTPVVGHVG